MGEAIWPRKSWDREVRTLWLGRKPSLMRGLPVPVPIPPLHRLSIRASRSVEPSKRQNTAVCLAPVNASLPLPDPAGMSVGRPTGTAVRGIAGVESRRYSASGQWDAPGSGDWGLGSGDW
jgi:hypothetical protein